MNQINKQQNQTLKSIFDQVLTDLQKCPLMDSSRLNSVQQSDTQMDIKNIKQILNKISPVQYHNRLLNEFFYLGPIEELIQDTDISEIIINGKHNIIYEKKGQLHDFNDSFFSDLTFQNFINRILEESSTLLSLKQPFVDGNWRGFRLHIAREPVVNVNFHLSFRRHPLNPWTFKQLKNHRWAGQQTIELIQKLLTDKENILIVGSTSSGKTSVLNACLQFLPKNERIITIEDSSELQLPNVFSTKLLTRDNTNTPNTLLNIDQSELVKQSLRMRPDRIIMGETRSTEAKDLLMALATGHSGSLGTIHATNHKQALWRLEMLVQMGAPSWNTNTIRQMIVLSIKYLIVLGRCSGERKLMGIYKLSGVERTGFLFETMFSYLPDSNSFVIN